MTTGRTATPTARSRSVRGTRTRRSPRRSQRATSTRSPRLELKTLSKDNADWVARHLGRGRDARRRRPRDGEPARARAPLVVPAVSVSSARPLRSRAYRLGDFATALRELRTYRRISGRNDQLPMMVDCERGLGRPERALELGRSVGAVPRWTPPCRSSSRSPCPARVSTSGTPQPHSVSWRFHSSTRPGLHVVAGALQCLRGHARGARPPGRGRRVVEPVSTVRQRPWPRSPTRTLGRQLMWSRKRSKSKDTTRTGSEIPSPRPTSPWSPISSSPRTPTELASRRLGEPESRPASPSATPSPRPTDRRRLGEIDDDNPIDVDGSAAD